MAARLGDYIDFGKDQIEKTMKELNEKKKHEMTILFRSAFTLWTS